MIQSCEEAVREFMIKQHQYAGDKVHNIPDDVKVLRLRLMMEELGEVATAMHEKNMIEIADGLCDLVYVVVGTAIAYGIPFDKCFAEVQRSNMTKSPLNANQKGGKVGKHGAQFEPPQLQGILYPQDAETVEPTLPFGN